MRTVISITMLWVVIGLAAPGNGEQGNRTVSGAGTLPYPGFQTGDIILRSGRGFISDLFRKTSPSDQRFSHAGVIQVTDSGTYVVHIIGPSDPARSGHLQVEPVAGFCDSKNASEWAVFRYRNINEKKPLAEAYLKRLSATQVRFDESFDLTTSGALYCTELIHDMFRYIGVVPPSLTEINGHVFASLDQLYLDTRAIPVYQKINN